MKLNGATALITGGAVRIGRAICEALADRGCNVVIHYRNSAREAEKLARRLTAAGIRAHTVAGDLATLDGCRQVLREAIAKAGNLDILVNNASIFHRGLPGSLAEQDALDELRVNLLAPMFLMRGFAGQAKKGKIINLLDQRITRTSAEAVPYQVSKKALAGLTLSAALELAPGISVNGVAPGPVLLPAGSQAGVPEKAGFIPLKKRPRASDVAAAVVFLLESDSITGQIIFVDGGQHLLGVRNAPGFVPTR